MKKVLSLIILSIVFVVSGCSNKADHQGMPGMQHEGTDHGNPSGSQNASAPAVQTTWTLSQPLPQNNQDVGITIKIKDKDGKPIQDFDINHEKKMHLIVVSKDLSFFEHIHPDFNGNGVFAVKTKFPNGGDYKLYADFMPSAGKQTVENHTITVQGNQPQPSPLQPDMNLTKVIDGKEVTLSFDHIMANMDLNMKYTFKDEKTKQPITNLQPYLGAIGHVVIISEDLGQYLHVHPMDEKGSGPDAKFMTNFPKNGIYKIWGQFQQDGKVFTFPFTVKVP
jgi:hypothetical protein